MRRLRQLAERTPADRERYVDLLRAVAITMVVVGHWTVTVIGYDAAGNPTGRSALPELPWAYPLTWIAQVMPVFFFVGGYANAASLRSRRARGGDAAGWLLDRSARLVPSTSMLVAVLTGGALAARLVGADPTQIRTVVWFATVPLWFLAAYLVVVPLTPLTYALHQRFGLTVVVVLAALVGLGDLARITGHEALALGNYLLGWLAVHQLGYGWYDARNGTADRRLRRLPPTRRLRRLPPTRRTGWPLLVGGLVVLVGLTTVGPYPVSMLNIPGERLANAAPPSLALLALATAQFGLVLVLREPAERWLHRPGPWQAVIAVNAVVLTLFLWHLSAAILVIGGLDAVGLLPTPPVASWAWLAWRIPWLLLLSVVLAGLVALFGPVEARAGRRRTTHAGSGSGPGRTGATVAGPLRGALAGAGFAAVVAALAVNAVTPKDAPEPLGLPVVALVAYLAGAGLLRLLRSRPGPAAPTPAGGETGSPRPPHGP